MAEKVLDLRTAIGQQVRVLRKQVRQEIVALCARRWGLPWVRSTVAQIETGRRHLSAAEWILLPAVLNEAGIKVKDRPVTYLDLIPVETMIALTPLTRLYGKYLWTIVEAHGEIPDDVDQDKIDRPQTRLQQALAVPVSGKRPKAIPDALVTDADRKAADKLGVPLHLVTQAALATWKHQLVEERDDRLTAAGHDTAKPRRKQALRGIITRTLLNEIRPALARFGVPFKGEKRKPTTNKRRKL